MITGLLVMYGGAILFALIIAGPTLWRDYKERKQRT